MTPDEVAAYLALPVGAREALFAAPGPGFACAGSHCYTDGQHDPRGWYVYADKCRPWAGDVPCWMPADTGAILDVARQLADSREAFLESVGEGWYQAGVKVAGDGGHAFVSARGESARLAALRLLAAVRP